MSKHRVAAALAVAALVALAPAAPAQVPEWGTIKGQVVFNGEVPKRKVVEVDTDKPFCTKNGDVLSEDLVVDPKTKGVRWVMVWLLDEKAGNNIPIHPALARMEAKVVLDQPCCAFEPHVLGMRTGQVLVAKNSATVTHNVNIIGGDDNPNLNKAIPPGRFLEVEEWKASPRVVPIRCTIHKWMSCWVRVFDHPYFAVTNEKGEFVIKNAPAGKYRIVIWQESVGWVVQQAPDFGKKGIPIEIKPDLVTDLGAIKLTPAKD